MVFASPHSGNRYPERFVRASRLDRPRPCAAPRTRSSTSCSRPPRGSARRCSRHVPARLCRSQPRALGARPRDVRGRAARLSSTRAVAAGARRARHDRARRRERDRDLSRASSASPRRAPASRRSTGPTTRRLTGLVEATHRRFGHALLIDCHSMPSVGGPIDRDPGRRRVDFVLGDCHGAACGPRRRWRRVAAALKREGYLGGAQRALCRRLHHPPLRPARRRDAMRCRSRSIARSTWTRRASSAVPASTRWSR